MKCSAILSSLLLLAVPSLAQTPSGFTPGTNATLDVYYGTQYISPGLVVKKSSTQKAPVIGLTNTTLTGKYLLAMIGTPLPFLSPLSRDQSFFMSDVDQTSTAHPAPAQPPSFTPS
jgi:hypothetical protein